MSEEEHKSSFLEPLSSERESYTDSKNKKLNIFEAILMEDNERLDELLDARTNKIILTIKQQDKLKRTPLYFAAQLGKTDIVDRLLKTAISNIESPDMDGWSSLYVACLNGHKGIVDLLLENHSNIEAKESKYGWTPLFAAICNGHLAVVKLLLSEGAAFDAQDNTGRTPLWVAVMLGYSEIVSELIQRGANVNAVDTYGRTPAYIAVQMEKIDALKILIDNGADIEIADRNERTPLILAYRLGLNSMKDYLIEKGAKQTSLFKLIEEEEEAKLGTCRGNLVKVVSTNPVKIMTLAIEDSRIWGGGNDGSLLVWDLATCELLVHSESLQPKQQSHQKYVHSIVVAGDEVWTLSGNKEINIWKFNSKYFHNSLNKKKPDIFDSKSLELIKKFTEDQEIYCLASNVQTKEVYGGSSNNSIYIWQASKPYTGRKVFLPLPEAGIAPEFRFICEMLWDNTNLYVAVNIVIYCLNSKLTEVEGVLKGHTGYKINDMVCAQGRLWSCASDETIRVWDRKKCIQVINEPKTHSFNCLVNIGDTQMLSGGQDCMIKSWSAKSFELTREYAQNHTRDISCMCWVPQTKKLWVSSLDKTISIWE